VSGPGTMSQGKLTSAPEGQAEEVFEEFDLADIVEQARDGIEIAKIPKPDGMGSRDFNVRRRMGLEKNSEWYTDIIVCIPLYTHQLSS
jgi:hypothetical protein